MAGARLAEELTRAGPDRFAVTVIGAERQAAYNRIMLSAVLAGDVAPEDIRLAAGAGVDRRLGEHVASIDRAARRVLTHGDAVSYDTLVLATGFAADRAADPGAGLPNVLTCPRPRGRRC
jgi:NAD(P)H-nitrite reductase large subunit